MGIEAELVARHQADAAAEVDLETVERHAAAEREHFADAPGNDGIERGVSLLVLGGKRTKAGGGGPVGRKAERNIVAQPERR